MKTITTTNGKEIAVESLCWSDVKSLRRRGCVVLELKPLLRSNDGHMLIENIVIKHTSLEKEEIEKMQSADLMATYAEIICETILETKAALLRAVTAVKGKEAGFTGLTWTEVKGLYQEGYDMDKVDPLMLADEAQMVVFETIILNHSSLKIEQLEGMRFAHVAEAYMSIFLATVGANIVMAQSIAARKADPKLTLVVGGKKQNGR